MSLHESPIGIGIGPGIPALRIGIGSGLLTNVGNAFNASICLCLWGTTTIHKTQSLDDTVSIAVVTAQQGCDQRTALTYLSK